MVDMSYLQNFIAKGGTPKTLLEQTVLKNPMMNNLIRMAKSGNIQDIEMFARNLLSEQGRDFDSEFAEFRRNFNR